MSQERVLIVGANVAGARAAESLRQHGFDGPVTLVGAEPELPYHRPPLSKEMLGAEPVPDDELVLQPAANFAAHGIELVLGTTVTSLDAAQRAVTLASGRQLAFDKLLIATGASPRRLAVPGSTLDGVVYLRTVADARVLRSRIHASERIVVVGAGILGLEIAAAARALGREIVVLEQGPLPLRRVFHPELARRIAEHHARKGVDIRMNVAIRAIEGNDRVHGVRLADGTLVEAQLVVVAIGVEPNTSWLRGSGVTVSDGVLVNEMGQTAVPGIYAAGDVARIYSRRAGEHLRFEQYGHAHELGAGVGRTIAGVPYSFDGVPSASTSVYGVRAQSVGVVRPGLELVMRSDGERMVGVLVDAERVVAAFAFDRARDFTAAKRLVVNQAQVPRSLLADQSVPLLELVNGDR